MKKITFKDSNNNNIEFRLFNDSDVGMMGQKKIKTLFRDNDVDSDDEFIKSGVRINSLNISAAIKLLKNKDENFVGKYLEYFNNF